MYLDSKKDKNLYSLYYTSISDTTFHHPEEIRFSITSICGLLSTSIPVTITHIPEESIPSRVS
jgi:hypothetical protein